MIVGEVEVIHRARHIEIGIGIEAVDEAQALVAQIALDLEIGVEGEGAYLAILQVTSELALEGPLGQIGDVGCHPRHGPVSEKANRS